jgi:hypothetical protein
MRINVNVKSVRIHVGTLILLSAGHVSTSAEVILVWNSSEMTHEVHTSSVLDQKPTFTTVYQAITMCC